MNYIKQNTEFQFIINIKVKPNSKIKRISKETNELNYITAFLLSKPIQNKANKELVNLLKKKLKIPSNQIKILSGIKSNFKTLELNFLERQTEKGITEKLLD